MKPPPFAYHDPRTTDEALALLAEHGDDAKILAGGQSLMPMLALRLARPGVVVDINRVAGLDRLHVAGRALRLGALVRQRVLERWALDQAPLVAAVLRMVGHVAIRTRGTVAGSVSHGDPASELPALFLALDGVATARSRGGEREIPAAEMFLGPLTTSLRSDEIVVETRWSLPAATAGWGFHEVARRHGDFALVGAIAVVTVAGGRIETARLALFGAGSTPVRAAAAEKALVGATAGAAAVGEAARIAADGLDPVADLHATAQYRRRVARTLTERALTDALARVGGGR
ncbi:MAG: FAD binding domain-containing protein [Candidatus Rokubacteria bacterium]|nr:FAD binding domain-containing protein [Candidatus Rokubacteria bacterium]